MASSPPHPQADAENVKVADARLNDSAPASHATQTADIYSSSVSLIPVAANKKSQPITYRRTKLTVLDKTASERGSTEPFAQISSNGNAKRKETDQNVLVPGSSSPLSSASSPTMSKPTKTTGATANNKKRANDSVEIIPKPGKKKRTDERKVEFGISTGTQDGGVVAGGSDASTAAPTTAASRRGVCMDFTSKIYRRFAMMLTR
ncbi:hypothetical protein DL93DRAFT_405095 [Clavulina sp. PMI_390]|nr:hypothetical protein DL93DRAFT_405095 [Clavulina sp. PMI_390]